MGNASTLGSVAPAAGTGCGAGLRFGFSDPEEPGVVQLWHTREVEVEQSGMEVSEVWESGGGGRGAAELFWHPSSASKLKAPCLDADGVTVQPWDCAPFV